MPDTPVPKSPFQGFSDPNYTPVPDELFDELLAELSGAELKVLLYIIRRTYGFKKRSDRVSKAQLENGIQRGDGTPLDHGTGLSRRAIRLAVDELVERGILIKHAHQSAERGFEATEYSLRKRQGSEDQRQAPPTDDGRVSGSAPPGVLNTQAPPGVLSTQAWGPKVPKPLGIGVPIQETGSQETDRQETGVTRQNEGVYLSNSKAHTRTRNPGGDITEEPSTPAPPRMSGAPGLTRIGDVIRPTITAAQPVGSRSATPVAPKHPIPQEGTALPALPLHARPSEKPEKAPQRRRMVQGAPPGENGPILGPTALQTQRSPSDVPATERTGELAALDYAIEEISAKLGDTRHRRSNVTQARNLLARSGLNANAWTGLVWSVYHRTAEQKGRLARPMAWFFTALREDVEERTAGAGGGSLLASLAEHLAEQGGNLTPPTPTSYAPLPRDTEPAALWQAVLDELAHTVTRPIYETYLAGTHGVGVEAGRLLVRVPSEFAVEWLATKLRPLIHQQLGQITGIAAGVVFQVEPGSAELPPAAADAPSFAQTEHAP